MRRRRMDHDNDRGGGGEMRDEKKTKKGMMEMEMRKDQVTTLNSGPRLVFVV